MERADAGQYIVDEDDDGRKFWRGGSPGDKDEARFDPCVPLILCPETWPKGTMIQATEPIESFGEERGRPCRKFVWTSTVREALENALPCDCKRQSGPHHPTCLIRRRDAALERLERLEGRDG